MNLPLEADVSGICKLSLSRSTTIFPWKASWERSDEIWVILAVCGVKMIGKFENFLYSPSLNWCISMFLVHSSFDWATIPGGVDGCPIFTDVR